MAVDVRPIGRSGRWAELQIYGFGLGLQLLARADVRAALKYMAIPVNYWRACEFQLALEAGGFRRGERVLDIGSPKLLAVFLADRVGCSVLSTDIETYFVDGVSRIRDILRIPPEHLRLATEDGRALSYPKDSFDKVYAISVVEHIPGEGDSQCLREIERVLVPGGVCILTVPFWPESRVDHRDRDFYWAGSSEESEDGRVFFQRRYSESDLHRRLIEPSGLQVERIAYVGERVLARSRHELCEFLPPVTGPLQPLLSHLLLTPAASDWRAMSKPLCALLVLKKRQA